MHAGEVLIPILICLGFFAMVFGIVYMHKRENLAMVEKGMNPKQYRPVPYKNLKWGLLLVGAGIGLLLAYILDDQILRVRHNPSIYFSMLAIGAGSGLVASYRIEKKELLDKQSDQ
jgi:uncharacterized oligopeptide transporter (OPT) family protein